MVTTPIHLKDHTSASVVEYLTSLKNPSGIAGMAHFGITAKNPLGISIPTLRALAKVLGKDHALALALWKTGIHEVRHLAGMIDDPKEVTEEQMDAWITDFDSWDVCDGVCMNLFHKTPFAIGKAKEWTHRTREYERRAGFALMAALSFRGRTTPDTELLAFLPLIEKYSSDDRNFVKKAVNWALRQIGKKNVHLHAAALRTAKKILAKGDRSSLWIARDAIRELEGR